MQILKILDFATEKCLINKIISKLFFSFFQSELIVRNFQNFRRKIFFKGYSIQFILFCGEVTMKWKWKLSDGHHLDREEWKDLQKTWRSINEEEEKMMGWSRGEDRKKWSEWKLLEEFSRGNMR